MIAKGNGNPARCVNNLLQIVRGEVAFNRQKGIQPRIVDMQADEAAMETEISARWNIENYEPRVSVNDINITSTAARGEFNISADVKILR